MGLITSLGQVWQSAKQRFISNNNGLQLEAPDNDDVFFAYFQLTEIHQQLDQAVQLKDIVRRYSLAFSELPRELYDHLERALHVKTVMGFVPVNERQAIGKSRADFKTCEKSGEELVSGWFDLSHREKLAFDRAVACVARIHSPNLSSFAPTFS